MDSLPVGEFKSQFADILSQVRLGKRYLVTYGKKKEKIAVLVPYNSYQSTKEPFKLGLLKNKGELVIHDDFEMTDEEFLNS